MNKLRAMLNFFYAIISCVMLIALQASAQLTNHVVVKPGVYFELWDSSGPCDNFQSGEMIKAMLINTNQHVFYGRSLPPEKTFVFELHDAAGKKVAKTALGIENSQSIDSGKITPRQGGFGSWHGSELFKPEDFFVITNAGVYTLEVQMRYWSEITNKQYGVVITPTVRVQVEKK